MLSLTRCLVWIVLPSLNFFYFMRYSSSIALLSRAMCPPLRMDVRYIFDDVHCPKSFTSSGSTTGSAWPDTGPPQVCASLAPADPLLISVDTDAFDTYRAKQLAPAMGEYGDTLLLQLPTQSSTQADAARCTELHQHYASSSNNGNCFAVAFIDHSITVTRGTITLRFDHMVDAEGHQIQPPGYVDPNADPKAKPKVVDKKLEAEAKSLGNASHNVDRLRPGGHFRRVPKVKGFARVLEKLQPFLANLDGPGGMAAQLQAKLDAHHVKAGDDLVVMVVNEGEIDLFLNFACSCRLHGLPLNNMLVFSGSPEVRPPLSHAPRPPPLRPPHPPSLPPLSSTSH